MSKKLVGIDLFCGCGGASLGYENAGINLKYGIDVWNKAVESYNKNLKSVGLCRDLIEYTPEIFEKECKIKKLDIIVGSFPCQGFSMAGKRNKSDPRNKLYEKMVNYISYFSPKAFIMENVIGLLSMKNKKNEKIIDKITSSLNENYNISIFKLLASDYGVPQARKRVFIIGYRKDLNTFPTEPTPTTKENPPPVKNILEKHPNIKNFLSKKAIEGIKRRKKEMKEKKYGFGAKFLDLDKPCYTISARIWKDGYDALIKYDENKIRRLTELELLRIQAFPDDYELCGTKKDRIVQIGNAVPSKITEIIGRHVMRELKMKNKK